MYHAESRLGDEIRRLRSTSASLDTNAPGGQTRGGSWLTDVAPVRGGYRQRRARQANLCPRRPIWRSPIANMARNWCQMLGECESSLINRRGGPRLTSDSSIQSAGDPFCERPTGTAILRHRTVARVDNLEGFSETVKRYIDGAIVKFSLALAITTVALFAVIALWVGLTVPGRQFPFLNVAFVASWLVALVSVVPILIMAKRRPADKVSTWGEAMVAAVYVFFILFWIYGTVPHQWLTYADSELNWRSDKFLIGPRLPWDSSQGVVEWASPFTITYTVVKDIVAVLIYGVGLVANVALVSIWQKRGDAVADDSVEDRSRYGRPLLKSTKVGA